MSKRNARPVNAEPEVEPPVRVAYGTPEGGGETFGDVLVLNGGKTGGRRELAADLRNMADVLGNTLGDPIEDYTILVVLRRPAG